MAPGAELRFLFDSFPRRKSAGLPMTVSGRFVYGDDFGGSYDETFVIDLDVYDEARVAEKDIVDLVGEVKELRQELKKWTDGGRGLLVHTVDRDKDNVRQERPFVIWKLRSAVKDHGWRSGLQYYIGVWRRRRGL